MKVKEVAEKLGLTVISGANGLENEISMGYSSDLLSDVMGSAQSGDIWITLQTHKNVMAIASLKDLSAVILVKGFTPDPDMEEQSNEENIPVLGTTEDTFTINGKLYNLLNQ
ncbi:MAG: thiamine biosynthesis protein [Bacteroidetes bacterium]|jgi:predicted transcriptional regulator|nr:MAG: thiamine biosynthesis protein [Bacteroidota bacterium]